MGKSKFRLDSVDDLFRWGPHITIQNTGEEVIDGIRVEVDYMAGRAYGFGVEQKWPVPIVTPKPSTSEITTFGKLMPRQKATISLISSLLDQMQQASTEVYLGKDRQGFFRIQVFCRLFGATTYDAIEPRQDMSIDFHWRHTVFADREKCEAARKLPPSVKIE